MRLAVLESHEMLSFLQGLHVSGALIVSVTPRELRREGRSTDYLVISFNVFYIHPSAR